MPITPLDIKKQDFSGVFRGYDKEEVDTFLEMIAREWEMVIKKNAENDHELTNLRDQLKKYMDMEETMKQSLVNAVKVGESARGHAAREADLLIKKAKLEAETQKRKLQQESVQIRQTLRGLKEQNKAFIIRSKNFLRSQLELLSEMSYDDEHYRVRERLEEMPPLAEGTEKSVTPKPKKNESPKSS